MVKNLPANAGDIRDVGLIPGSGRSPGEENGNPFQCSCLDNPMDRGPWRAIDHGVKQSWAQLKWLNPYAVNSKIVEFSFKLCTFSTVPSISSFLNCFKWGSLILQLVKLKHSRTTFGINYYLQKLQRKEGAKKIEIEIIVLYSSLNKKKLLKFRGNVFVCVFLETCKRNLNLEN